MIEVLEVYPVPPADFCKRLHEYDSTLCLNWDPTHKVWAIWYKDPYDGSMNHVMSVVDEHGEAAPLDGRVFNVLERNRYYSKHPEELIESLVDSVPAEIAAQEKKVKDDLRNLSKDKAMQRQWAKVVETFRNVDWKSWINKKEVIDPTNGKKLMGPDGKPVQYLPHSSVLGERKPVI